MKCCGHTTSTPFCGYCGRPAPADPLSELLRHIESNMAQIGVQVDKATEAKDAKLITQRKNNYAKWEGWRDALEQAKKDAESFHAIREKAEGMNNISGNAGEQFHPAVETGVLK